MRVYLDDDLDSNALIGLLQKAGHIDLHHEWMKQQRRHYGILIVYRENNPARDMSFQQIAQEGRKAQSGFAASKHSASY